MNRIYKTIIILLFPIIVSAQNSMFDNSEATAGAIRNMSQYASTGTDAVIYNPAGLAFSEKAFQIAIGGIGGYQQIENRPFSIESNGDTIMGMPHRSTIIRATPSVQACFNYREWSFSFSYAVEGGGGVWRDLYGNVIIDSFFQDYGETIEQWQNYHLSLQQYLVNDEDVICLSSQNFKAKFANNCIRMGVTYRLFNYFSCYLGCKSNSVFYSNSVEGGIYVQRPSTNERWLFSDYIMSTQALVNNDYIEYSEQIQNSVTATSDGVKRTFAFAPVVGLGFNYHKLNIGLKYELSPNVLKYNEDVRIPHDLSVGASILCLHDKLSFSAGADFKWGYYSVESTTRDAIVQVNNPNSISVLYGVTLGLDYKVNDRLLVSTSAAFGNMCYSLRGTGYYLEVPLGIEITSARFSLGLQYKINHQIMVDFGYSMNPYYGMYLTTDCDTYFVNLGVMTYSHCGYRYMPRFAAGLGLTYSF